MLISQYADDTSLYIQPEIESLKECMKCLSDFEYVSGLKINIEKTKVIKIGGWRDSRIILCPKLNLIWTNKFDSLGIKYDTSEMDHITEITLESRMKEIRSLINIWTPRNLTQFGKITIIKSLLISKVTHILLSLPNPKTQTLYEIDCLFKNKQTWKNKRPKYRPEILEHNQLDGGLGYPNLADFNDALNISWIKRIYIGEEGWRVFPKVYGIDKVLIYGAKYVDKMFKKVETGFWKDFLLALQKFHQKCSPASFEEFWLAPLWYNNMGNLILRNNWVEMGIMQVKDELDSEGEIVERTHLNDMYNIQSNFLEYEQLAFSIKNKLNEFGHNRKQVICPHLSLLLSMVQCSNKGCSNIRKRMKGRNDNLLQNIQEH